MALREIKGVPGTRPITRFIDQDTERIAVDGIRLPKNVDESFPEVRILEIYKSKRVSSVLFDLFPRLKMLVVRYGVIVGETPELLPDLEILHLRSSPWLRPLEVAPNLTVLSLRETPDPVLIVGDEMESISLALTVAPVWIDLAHVGHLQLFDWNDMHSPLPPSVVKIGEAEEMYLSINDDTNVNIRVDRVGHLVCYSISYLLKHPFAESFAFVETLSMEHMEEITERINVENVVVQSHRLIIEDAPLLRRVVLQDRPNMGTFRAKEIEVSVRSERDVTLILDLPNKDLRSMKIHTEGVEKIVAWRRLNESELDRIRTETGVEVIPKRRIDDEDHIWYSQYRKPREYFPGDGNIF